MIFQAQRLTIIYLLKISSLHSTCLKDITFLSRKERSESPTCQKRFIAFAMERFLLSQKENFLLLTNKKFSEKITYIKRARAGTAKTC
mgnify:CR=1 FL=1